MPANNTLTRSQSVLRFVLPLLVLLGTYGLITVIKTTSPSAEKRQQPPANILSVETMPIIRTDYQLSVQTNGVIKPSNQVSLISQVSGLIVKVSPTFTEGGFFSAGDVLLEVDNRDYLIAVRIAEAALITAQLSLEEEKARAAQARRDWQRLARKGEPNALVLRKPQLASAHAALASAAAKLEQARLDLERTKLIAPYSGRILSKKADFGQYVNIGSELAKIYATDYVEIRLPLNTRQQDFISLPEQFRGTDIQQTPKVLITARFGTNEYTWQGRLTRTEGALDEQSRQLYVVAQIIDPYGKQYSAKPALKIGQFVQAEITGKQLSNIFVLPTDSVYEGDQVIIYHNGVLERRDIRVIWQNQTDTVADQGLTEHELLVTTPLDTVLTGTRARLAAEGPR